MTKTAMILTTIFAVISVVGFIVFKVYFETKITTRWLAITIEAFLVLVIIPIVVNLLMPLFNAEEQRKNELFQKTITDAIINQNLDRKELEELILRQRKEIFQSSENEAQKFVKSLTGHEDEKRKEFATLRNRTKELADKLYLKWKPFTTYVLASFDKRITELQNQKTSIGFEIRKDDFGLVIDIDSTRYTETRIRKVNFSDKFSLSMSLGPGQIQQGLFLHPLVMDFHEVSPTGWTWAFSIRCYDDLVKIETTNIRYKNIVGQTSRDALNDDEFINKINESLNQLIATIYFQGSN